VRLTEPGSREFPVSHARPERGCRPFTLKPQLPDDVRCARTGAAHVASRCFAAGIVVGIAHLLREGQHQLRLTIDSSEALEDTLRVVGALYDVTLEVSSDPATGDGADTGAGSADSSARRARGTRGGARRGRGNQAAGKRSSSRRSRNGKTGADGKVSTAAVRSWARENGYAVADRGRVPAELVTAYRNAQPA